MLRCVLGMLLTCGLAWEAFGAEGPARPNILLIVADDLGWADVGWHEGFAKTPNLDRLVRTGVELDRHYVQPVCTPTRAALMTGRYPGRFGPHVLVPSNLRALPTGTITLAAALKSLGYTTSLSGKWHLGSKPEWTPNHYGFDHSYGSLSGAVDPWTHKYRKGPYEDTWHRDGRILHEEGNATELVAREAIRRIRENQRPWFVYVPFQAVHTPVDAPAEYKKLYDGVTFHEDPVKHDSRLRLAAMVSQLDAKVGEMVAALEATGQRENTLIIFTSDNGGILAAENPYVGKVPPSPFNSDNRPLRGQKGQLYEGGIRVCAFANWPGKLKPGQVTTPMHAVDWFPTVAEVVGYRPEQALPWDGVSQWPVLSGQGTPPARSIYIAARSGAALIHDGWKLILPAKGRPELYDLTTDPYEKTNRADQEPERLADLKKRLAEQQSRDVTELPADLKDVPR